LVSAGGAAALLALTEQGHDRRRSISRRCQNLLVAVDTVERFVNVHIVGQKRILRSVSDWIFEAEITRHHPSHSFLAVVADTVYSLSKFKTCTALLKHYEPTGNLDRLAMQLFTLDTRLDRPLIPQTQS